MKNELHRLVFANQEEAKCEIFDYIEVFYNRKRSHSYLGYLSPEAFETSGLMGYAKDSVRFILNQLRKDTDLMTSAFCKKVEWHLFAGGDPALIEKMRNAGIKVFDYSKGVARWIQ